MGKGSPIVKVRVRLDTFEALQSVVERSGRTRAEAPWTISTFVQAAIREKLSHIERLNKKKRRPSA